MRIASRSLLMLLLCGSVTVCVSAQQPQRVSLIPRFLPGQVLRDPRLGEGLTRPPAVLHPGCGAGGDFDLLLVGHAGARHGLISRR